MADLGIVMDPIASVTLPVEHLDRRRPPVLEGEQLSREGIELEDWIGPKTEVSPGWLQEASLAQAGQDPQT